MRIRVHPGVRPPQIPEHIQEAYSQIEVYSYPEEAEVALAAKRAADWCGPFRISEEEFVIGRHK